MDEQIRRTLTTGVRVDAITGLDAVVGLIRERLHARSPLLMTFMNPAGMVGAQKDPQFAQMLDRFDVVAPDGIAVALAIHWLHNCPAERISFDCTSLALAVLRLAVDDDAAIVICGGRPGIAECARRQLVAGIAGLKIVGTFDGYSSPAATIAAIKQLAPQIVICGMGSPLQESFLLELAESGWSGMGFTCGGFLDQLCEKGMHYYPKLIDCMNLRWAYRLAREPRRLWRRYLLVYPVFALGVCKALLSHA